MLKKLFLELAANYSSKAEVAVKCWNELEAAYGDKSRHYHNLEHLANLFLQLEPCRDHIGDWNTVAFAVYYHDAVYSALKNNNEEKSAELAEERLPGLGVPPAEIKQCVKLILATKGHTTSDDEDFNIFTDADLSILGQPWPVYETYLKQIRQEYSIYPDLIYNPGRKKVLNHFLQMPRIYKTEFFFCRYESQARENMAKELGITSS